MTSAEFNGTVGETVAESTPHWAAPPAAPPGAPNILIMMLDDVGFADFGCYGSEVDTPNFDQVAERGLRYSGFHTTAMCSTTRASLHTGRNHHSVGMGCLANFDSGYPGYRGKIAADAPTLAETLRPHGYRTYYAGKWHVTPLTESGPTGPFDGWPLARGFDRFYGFLDAETDQYSPELVRDNSHIDPPGNFASGYHFTEDMFSQSIAFLKGHIAGSPTVPWLMMAMPGACHAPHQAPAELIAKYDERFAKGWDQTRADRLAHLIALGLVPPNTELPDRNHMVRPWDDHTPDEQRLFTRLAAAYAAMLEHADQHFGRLMHFLEVSGQLDNTIVVVTSDNGASQEGGPNGFVNAMGPYNGVQEDMAAKIARIDDIGGPDTHSNFPWGWAMASNTPLKRYKQNTHSGGVRDPLIIAGPGVASGGIRHNFCHVADLAPTLLDHVGLPQPHGTEGTSFAVTLPQGAGDTTDKTTQYFEMFGHRGLWHDGWKAVAYHAPGTAFEDDQWELYHLATDFNECHDLAQEQPEQLAAMLDLWWKEAAKYKVLPLDDRFAERFAENAERHRGERTQYTFWRGMGHVPAEVAPDLRSRSYRIEAEVDIPASGAEGVLVAHGDATSGYSLFVRDGKLVHDLNVGGSHQLLESDRPVPAGPSTLGFVMRRTETDKGLRGRAGLLINGEVVAEMETSLAFWLMISWSGLDVGTDRGTTVADYDRTGRFMDPYRFTGTLTKVTITLGDDQTLDFHGVATADLARD